MSQGCWSLLKCVNVNVYGICKQICSAKYKYSNYRFHGYKYMVLYFIYIYIYIDYIDYIDVFMFNVHPHNLFGICLNLMNLFWHKKHEIGWWRFWPCLSICLKEPTNLLPSTSVRDTKRKGSGSGWANIDICLSDFCAPLPMNGGTWRLIVISYYMNVIIMI